MAINTNDLHGPTQLDLNPKPPNSVRLSKRAGYLGLAILGVVGILVFFGIATRSDRQFKLGFHPDEARNVTAATDVGKSIAAKVSARPASDLREPAKQPQESDELTAPPLTYRPAKVQQSYVSQPVAPMAAAPPQYPQPVQSTPQDRRRELALQREMEAMDAPTAAHEGSVRGSAGNSFALPNARNDLSQMTQLLQALQGPNTGSAAKGPAGQTIGGVPRISIGGQSVSAAANTRLRIRKTRRTSFSKRQRAGMSNPTSAKRVSVHWGRMKFMHGIKVLMAKNYIDNLSEDPQRNARKGRAGHLAFVCTAWVQERRRRPR